MKRFYVRKPDGGICFRAKTTLEVYQYLKETPAILTHYIGDSGDDDVGEVPESEGCEGWGVFQGYDRFT